MITSLPDETINEIVIMKKALMVALLGGVLTLSTSANAMTKEQFIAENNTCWYVDNNANKGRYLCGDSDSKLEPLAFVNDSGELAILIYKWDADGKYKSRDNPLDFSGMKSGVMIVGNQRIKSIEIMGMNESSTIRPSSPAGNKYLLEQFLNKGKLKIITPVGTLDVSAKGFKKMTEGLVTGKAI